jgi:hypothetical protein
LVVAKCARREFERTVVQIRCPGAALVPACFLSAADKSVFPVAPIEKAARTHLGRIEIVEAASVDAEILRIGPGNVEGVDAAMAAEGMLRDAGIEAIGGEIVMAAQQFELPGCDTNVKDALLSADRAVAFARKGSHGTLHYGNRKTTVKDLQEEIGVGPTRRAEERIFQRRSADPSAAPPTSAPWAKLDRGCETAEGP